MPDKIPFRAQKYSQLILLYFKKTWMGNRVQSRISNAGICYNPSDIGRSYWLYLRLLSTTNRVL